MTSSATNRLLLTDASVEREPLAAERPRIVRDTKIPGFHLWVGRTTKTFRMQFETPRVNGQRGRTKIVWLGEYPHCTSAQARAKAFEIQSQRARGHQISTGSRKRGLTFREAWEAYRAALTKAGKSARTVADYDDKFRRHLAIWHDTVLAAINREQVIKEHAVITERAKATRGGKYSSGKYAANGSLRLARAVWNFAKDELEAPGLHDRNPFRSGKLFHKERGRETGMGAGDLPRWWAEVQALPNPIRRELHLFHATVGPS